MDGKEKYLFSNSYKRPDWDADSGDSEVILKFANCNNLCMLASAVGKLAGDLKSPPEYLEEFFEKLKVLEEDWHTTEKKYQALLVENETLQNLLENERSKNSVLNKRLKFIQDNQKKFEKLKQVYLNMKYNETVNKKVTEVREDECQTDEQEQKYPSSIGEGQVVIDRLTIANAQETLRKLKELVQKREESFSQHVANESALRTEMASLKEENEALHKQLNSQKVQMEKLNSPSEVVKCGTVKENEIYKSIIVKLEKKLKDTAILGKCNKILGLNEEELNVLKSVINTQKVVKNNCNMESKKSNKEDSNSKFLRTTSSRSSMSSKEREPANEIEILSGKLKQMALSKSNLSIKDLNKLKANTK